MGVLREQIVVCTTYDWDSNDRSKLDSFVEQHPKFFVKLSTMINGVINYIMFWDGSKEGWPESDEADELREQFINLLKKLGWASIYEIDNYEHENPILEYTFILDGEIYDEDS